MALTSSSAQIIYILIFSCYQATTTTQAQIYSDYVPLNLTTFLEQLMNFSYSQNNRNDYNNQQYYPASLPFTDQPHDTNNDEYVTPHPNYWDDWDTNSNRSNLITSTMIAVAIALIVLIKLTLIALMVRRGRRLQQRMSVVSSNQISIPNEFDNDSAHLVTPATIMYVEPETLDNTNGVPTVPCSTGTQGLLMTPPPYSEVSTDNLPSSVCTPKDDYPPPAYQELPDA
ncbi:uncharacterized protein [Antedon mediterranea]|uniref:uncharacterized protein n=1 Tax=Antedon mediterranea TaxID=105859 RepID=UPI003AF4D810